MAASVVLDYLNETAQKYPDKTAFTDEIESVTFGELKEKAMALGTFIVNNDLHKSPVLVLMEKSVKEIVCFMGILYSGNFYCPVDTSLPDLRIQNIINTLKPEMIITMESERERADRIVSTCDVSVPVYKYDESLFAKKDLQSLSEIKQKMIDTDIVYTIFTSGSTGVPKGVCVCNRSIVNFIDNFTDAFNITEKDVLGNQAPFDFDLSVKDIYSAIKTGSSVYIIPRLMFTFTQKLNEYFTKHGITTLIWAVSALCMVANADTFMKGAPLTVKKILFSGEVMPVKQLNYWRRHIPGVMCVNLYGPTEITCNCLYYIIDREFIETDMLPLGKAFAHTEVIVLNEDNKPISENETGEICVRGSNLALGYYNNPQQTEKAFVQNPLNLSYPELIYRTGDLAKYNENGELVFASRRDFQIKHMGHRIEMNEIEIAVNSLENIEAAVCLYDEKKEKIVLVYKGVEANPKYILEGIKPVLPKYMFPQVFNEIEEMPYTKNMKIDRVRLKEIYIVV